MPFFLQSSSEQFKTKCAEFLSNKTKLKYKCPKYEPIVISSTSASLSKDGFLSAAGFQETKRVLTKAAIEGTPYWLRS